MTGDPAHVPAEIPPWLLDDVQQVIIAAIDQRPDVVVDRLNHIGNTGGRLAMFSACYTWATAAGVLSGLTEAVRRTGADGLIMQPLDGQPLDETSPAVAATRFFVAANNDDMDIADALFEATLTRDDPEHHQAFVIEIVRMVGDFGRLKQAEVDAARRRKEEAGTRNHQVRPPSQRRKRKGR